MTFSCNAAFTRLYREMTINHTDNSSCQAPLTNQPHRFLQTSSVFLLESHKLLWCLQHRLPEMNKHSSKANAKEKHSLIRPKGAWPLRKRIEVYASSNFHLVT